MTDTPLSSDARDSAAPTIAQLKADVDSGRTGDKVPGFDAGLSPLGTDDEAAGRPPSSARVALARFHETRQRWSKGARPASAAHHDEAWVLPTFIGFVGVAAVVLAAGIWRFS